MALATPMTLDDLGPLLLAIIPCACSSVVFRALPKARLRKIDLYARASETQRPQHLIAYFGPSDPAMP